MRKIVNLFAVVVIFLSTSCLAQDPIAPGNLQSAVFKVAIPEQVADVFGAATESNAIFSDLSPVDGFADYQSDGDLIKSYWVIQMINQNNGHLEDVMVSLGKLRTLSGSGANTDHIAKYSAVPFGAYGLLEPVIHNGIKKYQFNYRVGTIHYIIR